MDGEWTVTPPEERAFECEASMMLWERAEWLYGTDITWSAFYCDHPDYELEVKTTCGYPYGVVRVSMMDGDHEEIQSRLLMKAQFEVGGTSSGFRKLSL
jgi:hypothetical protein